MLQIQTKRKFEVDVERLRRQGKNIARLFEVIHRIANEEILPKQYRDHALKGAWEGYRDCHIAPDWILIYKIERDKLILICARTGSHAELKLE